MYDPEANPRYIGSEEPEPEVDEDSVADLTAKLAALDEAVETFATPGWEHLAAHLTGDVTRLWEALAGDAVSDMAGVAAIRGQLYQLRRILALPEQWAADRVRKTEELQLLQRPSDATPTEPIPE